MTKDFIFEYSQEFKDMIADMHKGKENLPNYHRYIAAHLGGFDSRLRSFCLYLYPEIYYYCGELKNKKVMDFGCGTGASTVLLALHSDEVFAYDVDQKSISICKKRVQEHGLMDKVTFLTGNFENISGKLGNFDFILLMGVVEHIPLSVHGLRGRILLSLFDILNPGGYLYITGTPNRLWPIDKHTTQLWWIPWAKPGSKWAFRRAVEKGRHVESPDTHSSGALGLEERGAWGATYFEIRKYLSGRSFNVVNLMQAHNRHIRYFRCTRTLKRNIFDFVIYHLISRWTKIPITAFAPGLSHLVIQRTSP